MTEPKDINEAKLAGADLSWAALEAASVPMPPAPGSAEVSKWTRPKARSLDALLGEAKGRIGRRAAGKEAPIPLPWPALAEQLGGGLWPGLHVIIGGTGIGKTQLALQLALHAADKANVPVLYVGLEMDGLQLAARVAGLRASVLWSDLYLGRIRGDALASTWRAAHGDGDKLLFLEEGPPNGWPFAWLHEAAREMRERFPERETGIRGSRPFLVILDFLQLVGDAPELRGETRALELRERIGRAAYAGRQVAREMDAAVLLVSSAARTAYGVLAGDVLEAGLSRDEKTGRRFILRPDVLVGLGKESGEIEYAADTVTAAIRLSHARKPDGTFPIILATAKARAAAPSWCALSFNGARLDVADEGEILATLAKMAEEAEKTSRRKTKVNGTKAEPTLPDDEEEVDFPARPRGRRK